MKKLLFILLMFLALPIMTNAYGCAVGMEYFDGSIPYEAIIKNKNGAKIYDEENALIGTIPYNAKIKVAYEEGNSKNAIIRLNSKEASNYVSDYENNEDNEEEYDEDDWVLEAYIKVSDISSLNDDYAISNKYLDEKITSTVLKDVVIKKGPAEGYPATNTTIKSGTTITFYTLNLNKLDVEEINYSPWVYVEYNGVKGFVNTYNASVSYGKKYYELIAPIDIKVSSSVTIPTNTILKGEFDKTYLDNLYVTYKGKNYNVNILYFNIKGNKYKFTANNDIKVYKTADGKKAISTIKKGTIFTSEYVDTIKMNGKKQACSIYYELNGVKGWILDGTNAFKNLDKCIIGKDKDCTDPNKPETNEEETKESEEKETVNKETQTDTKTEDINKSTTTSNSNSYYYIFSTIAFGIISIVLICLLIRSKHKKEETNN